MEKIARYLLLAVFVITLAACQTTAIVDANKPTPPKPAAGKAIMTGQVLLKSTGKPLPVETSVRLAQIYRQGGEGAFVLDIAHSPQTLSINNGYFTIVDIPPAEYLIIVGKTEEGNYVVHAGADGKPLTYKIEAGKVLDVGVITSDYIP